MPAQPAAREPEEDMETEGDSEVPQANGEMEEEREREGGEAEETMEESGEEHESERGSESEESEAEEEEEEESSEMDDEDCERRRTECLDEMSDLEKQFLELKEKLFRERLNQMKVKLDEVLAGKAGEYQDPLVVLQQNMQMRTQVAGIYRELCLQVIKHKHECEMQGARQHLESERTMLYDTMKTELLDKIRRLEEDKQSIDITSEWWSDEVKAKKCKRKNHVLRPERKKKALLVSGPYIVYMLRDIDILEDWAAIKKAKVALAPLKKKSEGRQPLSVRCEGGTLYYDGEKFCKGNSVLLEVNDDSPAQAVITAVSTGEVWLKRTDGSKTKIYISQLQKGKYSLRKA
ncbi:breast cancer metastasis-suppressor 1 [Clupea harengus]|uniref:Breast cancer metastasis-suppressor 1 n=1 Tax=Clupea harengus TaxID=7950 RepID=A0A6P3VMK1_CLUHA|nr:breast cancer metastasis-suppressor 1 [Clupea harengus]XP_031440518.1 breast cancer metastasis-suppressor 1 [Clupea harengus]